MKILLINGSHRQGNMKFMLQTMQHELKKQQPQVQITLINLMQKNLEYCNPHDYNCTKTQNCDCCRDDMKEMYQLIEKANIIVLGSPVYFSNVSGRMKTFMDRCNPFYFNGKLKNKHVITIGVGQSVKNQEFFNSFRAFADTLDMKLIDSFYALAQEWNSVSKNQKNLLLLKQFSRKIVQTHKNCLKSL